MALKVEHELHGRRRSRNIGVALVLGAFVVLVFGLTLVKMPGSMERFDHTVRPSITVPEPGQGGQ